MFVDGNFEEYCKEMEKSTIWGDDIEIRALEEILDRIICIYSPDNDIIEPLNKNFEEDALLKDVPPLNLTYHGNSHYNSLIKDEDRELPKMRHSSVLTI